MSTVRPFEAARTDHAALPSHFRTLPHRVASPPKRFAALPHGAASPRLPAKPRLSALDPSVWWVHALRRTLWRWQRRQASRTTAPLVWC